MDDGGSGSGSESGSGSGNGIGSECKTGVEEKLDPLKRRTSLKPVGGVVPGIKFTPNLLHPRFLVSSCNRRL